MGMDTSKESVALELAKWIAEKDKVAAASHVGDLKAYYLELFKECLAVVTGK